MSESPADQLTGSQLETFQKAKEASNRNNPAYAITLLRQIVDETPGHLESRRLLRANEMMKVKSASALDKLKIQPLILRGRGALSKSPKEAMNLAEDALENDPRSDQGNQLLSDAALALNLLDVAILALETLREAKPSNLDNLKALGKLYLDRKLPEKAQAVFDAALKIKPNDGEALKGMKDASAVHASQQGSWEENLDYRASLKDEKQSAELEQESRVVKSSEAIDQQLEKLLELYGQNNNNLSVVIKIASLYERKEDLISATNFLNWASHLTNQGDPEIEKRLDKIKTRQQEESMAAKRHAIEAAPADQQPALLEELKALEAQFADYRLQSAKESVARYPNDNMLRYELGKALAEAGQYKEAIPELQQAVKHPNVRYQAFNMLGFVFWKRNMLDFAVKQFQTAESEMLVMDDLKKEIIYNLGCVYDEAGKKDLGLEQFKKIYEVDSQYRDVAQRVESSYGH
ncbi:MAG: tetratricopeptide repeat protein [Methylacidiphilales bacterium]|nr:tetratricopeptide repeat protein [Candidatus Methylacidiphilales bacterium]